MVVNILNIGVFFPRPNCLEHQWQKKELEQENKTKDLPKSKVLIDLDELIYIQASCLIFQKVTVLIKVHGRSLSYNARAVSFFHEKEYA
jgi:hypothetical protein